MMSGSSPKQSNIKIEKEEEVQEEEEEISQDDQLYSWTFESNDLAQLVIGLRTADSVAYSYKMLDEYTVQIVAKGEVMEEEIVEISRVLGVPKNMVQFRFQPWEKTLTIKTEHKLVGGIPPVVKTIGTFKLLCFNLAVFQESTAVAL
jgi:hypothetical protein